MPHKRVPLPSYPRLGPHRTGRTESTQPLRHRTSQSNLVAAQASSSPTAVPDPFGSGPPVSLTERLDAAAFDRILGRVPHAWGARLIELLCEYPDAAERVRAAAATTSLVALKKLAVDPLPEVRAAVTLNQLIVDADVQTTLAQDEDERVVLALLTSRTPHRTACEHILSSGHVGARAVLVRRPLSPGLRTLIESRATTTSRHGLRPCSVHATTSTEA